MEKHEFEKHDCGALECNFCEVCKLPASNPIHSVKVCEHCGPSCLQGAAHNARVEDGARYTDGIEAAAPPETAHTGQCGRRIKLLPEGKAMAWKHEDGTLCCCSAPLAASGPATSQVSEERLTEIASAWEHLSQSQRDTGGLYWSEAIQIAGEVLDLRESRRVLVRAFSEFLDRLSSGRLCYYGDSIGYEPQIGTNEIERYRALLIPAQQEAGNASNH